VGYVVAAIGLSAEAVTSDTLWALVTASAVFVAGIAMTVPAVITLVGSRAGSARAAALGLLGLAVFAGASCGPLVAGLPLGFTELLLTLAVLLIAGGALIAIGR
jgi:YNFM family putative membrane transporter